MTTYEDTRGHGVSSSGPGWAVRLLAWVCVLFGLVICGGGVWLLLLGGSWYYALAGAGLIATGILLNHGSMKAVAVYVVVWGLTVLWAFWEVGMDGWALVPRLVAPTVILLLVLPCIPALRRTRSRV